MLKTVKAAFDRASTYPIQPDSSELDAFLAACNAPLDACTIVDYLEGVSRDEADIDAEMVALDAARCRKA